MCVCKRMCMCVQMHVHMHVCEGQRSMLSVFLNYSPPYFLKQGLFTELMVHCFDWTGWPVSLHSQHRDYRHAEHVGHLSLGSHACRARPLLMKPSPSPQDNFESLSAVPRGWKKRSFPFLPSLLSSSPFPSPLHPPSFHVFILQQHRLQESWSLSPLIPRNLLGDLVNGLSRVAHLAKDDLDTKMLLCFVT